ncbi:hypothetical protein V8F33_001769 [Rhypophila sp. PSN 637]
MEVWPDEEAMQAQKIQQVQEVTLISDHGLLARALKAHKDNKEDVATVIDEFFALGESGLREKYKTSAPNSAFRIESEDPVLYGLAPGARPPSRADTRSQSPLSLMTAQLAAGNVETVDPRTDQARYQVDLETAMWLSRREAANTAKSQLVPAERSEYPDYQWALEKYNPEKSDLDPAPPSRKRIDGMPVFLRCRSKEHRLGGLLTVLHSIPGMRNALLHIKAGLEPGEKPGETAYGYGHHPEWWKGQLILPPELQQKKDRLVAEGSPGADNISPPWEDELHRLVAFLDSSKRSYGTADILARCVDGGSPESDFFLKFTKATEDDDAPVVNHRPNRFVWDIPVAKTPEMHTLYDLWDMQFFVDGDEMREKDDPDLEITCPPEVLVFRFHNGVGNQQPEISETFFIDRYLKENRARVWQQFKTVADAFGQIQNREDELTWVNPKTGKKLERKFILEKSIKDSRLRIASIKNRAVWREHERNREANEANPSAPDPRAHCPACSWARYPAEDDPEGRPEGPLGPDELECVQFYEGKIRQMEKNLADIKKTQVAKEKLTELRKKLRSTYRNPDIEWNPTNKYTLRGIVPNANHLFIRIREQWIEMRFQNDTLSHKYRSFEDASKEMGETPYLIYATEEAMAEESALLTDALNTFVRLDNDSFKQELDEYEANTTPFVRKRSSGRIEDTTSSESKRVQRSPSTESADSMKPERDITDDDMSLFGFGDEKDLAKGFRESMIMNESVSAEKDDIEMKDVFEDPQEQEATSPDAGGGGLKGGNPNPIARLPSFTPLSTIQKEDEEEAGDRGDKEDHLAKGFRESMVMNESVSSEKDDTVMQDVFEDPQEQEATSPDAGGGGLKGGNPRVPANPIDRGRASERIERRPTMKYAESGIAE